MKNLTLIYTLLLSVLISACGGGGGGGGGGIGSGSRSANFVDTVSSDNDFKVYSVPEVGGWTIPTPVTFNTSTYGLTDYRQPGSRLFYISNSGSDPSGIESPTGQIYFWDGTQIVDASGSSTGDGDIAYGTDPMNPSGPIKPYKRWVYVAPRRITTSGINGAKVGAAWAGLSGDAPGGGDFRTGFPDLWLFKRGDNFDLQAEYLSFAQETDPFLTTTSGGSLAIPGGNSASQIQVVGAYGDVAQPRPRFTNPNSDRFLKAGTSIKHAAFLSLHFDGRGTNNLTVGGFYFYAQPKESVNILLEDLWLEALSGSSIVQSGLEITLRRVLITDGFNKIGENSHVQGLYTSGTRDARIRIEQSILMRNGWKHGDPELSWPPSGDQTWNKFDRNMYLSGQCDNLKCGVFDTVSMIGASGDQFRPGMRVERNFFYQGYLAMGASGGYPDSDGPTGTILDNILQRFKGSGTNDNLGHPGWGFELTSGANRVEVARNIITAAQHPAGSFGFGLNNLSWHCYSHTFKYATRNNNIHDNVFDSGTASAAIRIVDGSGNQNADANDRCGPQLGTAGTTGNQVVNNTLINASSTESEYLTHINSEGLLDDTVFTGNDVYPDRAAAAGNLGWVDPERTLKTYLVDILGVPVTSDDGFIEYFNEAKKQRRGYWREEYTARPLVNYIRGGFGIDAL